MKRSILVPIALLLTSSLLSGCGGMGGEETPTSRCGEHPLGVWTASQSNVAATDEYVLILLAGGVAFQDHLHIDHSTDDPDRDWIEAKRYLGTWSESEGKVGVDWSRSTTSSDGFRWTTAQPVVGKRLFLEKSGTRLVAVTESETRTTYEPSIHCGRNASPNDLRFVGTVRMDSLPSQQVTYSFQLDGSVRRAWSSTKDLSILEWHGIWSTSEGVLTIEWTSAKSIKWVNQTEDLPLPGPLVATYSIDSAAEVVTIGEKSGYHSYHARAGSSGIDDD